MVIPQTQPLGVNRLTVVMLQAGTPIAGKAVNITVKAAEGPPAPPPSSDVMGPVMSMMGMAMMMGMVSSVTGGIEGG
jgi:hypothetical protein